MAVVDLGSLRASSDPTDVLPQTYDPELIAQYWRRRPGAVAQRIVQLLSLGGGFLAGIALDIYQKKAGPHTIALVHFSARLGALLLWDELGGWVGFQL